MSVWPSVCNNFPLFSNLQLVIEAVPVTNLKQMAAPSGAPALPTVMLVELFAPAVAALVSNEQFEIVVFEVPFTKMAPPPEELLSVSDILFEKQEPVTVRVPAFCPIAPPPLTETQPSKVQLVMVTIEREPIICMAPPYSNPFSF